MVESRGSKNQVEARLWAYRDPASFQRLIDLLVEVSTDYLLGQVKAGAGVLQIFDSWAGSLSEDGFRRWCITPTRAIVRKLKAAAPDVPVIGFPRGSGVLAEAYAKETGIDAIGCDTSLPLTWIAERLQSQVPVQGNLDPVLLLAGGPALDRRVAEILAALAAGPFVFNLGHGILPETPPEHVTRLVGLVKNG
jgi:uroporphyrinogen decarboxylase